MGAANIPSAVLSAAPSDVFWPIEPFLSNFNPLSTHQLFLPHTTTEATTSMSLSKISPLNFAPWPQPVFTKRASQPRTSAPTLFVLEEPWHCSVATSTQTEYSLPIIKHLASKMFNNGMFSFLPSTTVPLD